VLCRDLDLGHDPSVEPRSVRLSVLALIGLAVFTVPVALARFFQLTLLLVAIRVGGFLPRRVSTVIGVTVAGVLFWSVISGVFFRVFLRVADAAFQEYDERSNRRLSRRRTSQDRQQRSRLPKVTKAHRILSVTAATSSQMNWSP
jgi:uncharacterized membrane protein